jgi:hypothetical protein
MRATSPCALSPAVRGPPVLRPVDQDDALDLRLRRQRRHRRREAGRDRDPEVVGRVGRERVHELYAAIDAARSALGRSHVFAAELSVSRWSRGT